MNSNRALAATANNASEKTSGLERGPATVSAIAGRDASLHADFVLGARASESPIAIACFLLFTVLPLRPLLSVPAFRRFMARLTSLDADLEYRAMVFLSSCIRETPSPSRKFLRRDVVLRRRVGLARSRDELYAHNYCVVDFALQATVVSSLHSSLAFNMLREATRPLIKCR